MDKYSSLKLRNFLIFNFSENVFCSYKYPCSINLVLCLIIFLTGSTKVVQIIFIYSPDWNSKLDGTKNEENWRREQIKILSRDPLHDATYMGPFVILITPYLTIEEPFICSSRYITTVQKIKLIRHRYLLEQTTFVSTKQIWSDLFFTDFWSVWFLPE